jgi:hypothetical protein
MADTNVVAYGDDKRKDFLSWDEYFMAMAFLAAKRSKDPATQVGAAIVNSKNRIVGMFCVRTLADLAHRGDIFRSGLQRFSSRVLRRRAALGEDEVMVAIAFMLQQKTRQWFPCPQHQPRRHEVHVRVPRRDECRSQ